MSSTRDPSTEEVIGYAIEVHRGLGPGLLESAYEECLCYEFTDHRVQFRRQVPLPIRYKGVRLENAYRMNIVVRGELILELKTVEQIPGVDLFAAGEAAKRTNHQFQRRGAKERHTENGPVTTCRPENSLCLCVSVVQLSLFF